MQVNVRVPVGQVGNWKVEEFTVTNEQSEFDMMRGMMNGGRYVPAGTYKRLIKCNSFNDTIMSNTPDEIRDQMSFIRNAKGEVLVNGLGLGITLELLLEKPEVTHITVIEKSDDVMKLTAPYFSNERVTIIHADAFEYVPPKGKKYGAVWHDIWDSICGDNLEQMKILRRKYSRKTEWQGCWCEYECKRRR